MPTKKRQKKEKRPKLSWKAVKRAAKLFKYLRPYRVTFIIGMIFLLGSSLTGLLFPGLMGKLVDAQGTESPESESLLQLDNINVVAAMLFGVFLVQAVFSFFRIILFSRVTENMLADLRQSTYNHIIRLPIDFFNRNRVGELNSRISADISVLQETFTTTLAEFIRQIIVIVAGIVFLTFYSVKLSLLMLATLPVFMVIAVLFGKKVRKLSKEAQDLVGKSNVIVEETLSAIQSVKAYVNEWFESSRYKTATDSVKSVALKNATWRASFASFIILCLFGSIVLVVWYGVLLREAGEITTGDLFSFILYSVFVGASFGGIADLFSQIAKAVGATERLMEILDTESEAEAKETQVKLKGKVNFKDVSFSYPTRPDIKVLNEVNFQVEPGENIAIVGASGAGKSTLTQLLLQFFQPDQGKILFDGENFGDDIHSVRSNMALVPQEVLLFGGTIKENIAYGNIHATEEEIIAAAKSANAWDFIQKFSDGLDTVVGERGIQLSGGQRQRIAIARAILKDPSILILDEATSALDSESESLVQDALERLMKGRTSFVIAHRLATIVNADKILVIEDGKIVESGTHQELIAKGGRYQSLHNLQDIGSRSIADPIS
ncbi:ATP-binding cassette domain-containing protein [Luteibaculum oceani]|uniref:ATP-binding cassette domain-containing protein n=1 Tax=Luteibaculum oceani TaxID=1294296 RepID=A0A5C6V8Y7_9FLAO|nr:ATP-binding cassette domain-containing protein [Luteibaculum oceani]